MLIPFGPRGERLRDDRALRKSGFVGRMIKLVQDDCRQCGGEGPIWFSSQLAWVLFDGAHVR